MSAATSAPAPVRPSPDQLDALTFLDACYHDPFFFVDHCCQLFEPSGHGGRWVPFRLWGAQMRALDDFHAHRKTIALKARQIGFSWLALSDAVWEMIFRPAAQVLIFSKRDEEAVELLAVRLKGILDRLPSQYRWPTVKEFSNHEILLSNGSRAKAFPTTGGRSYTGTLAIVDEADFVVDLAKLLDAVEPTVAHGGRLILISTADKSRPMSAFKKIYQAARKGDSEYHAIFCPWWVRPGRTQEWYEGQRKTILSRDGSLDMLWQEYPATDTEAIAPRTLDKRIAPKWLEACYAPTGLVADDKLAEVGAPSLPGLEIYALPYVGRDGVKRTYAIGGDPAEGNPTSDDSASDVLDCETGEQVATIAGKFQPAVLAGYIAALSDFYNGAAVMVERNNHGHAVLLALSTQYPRVRILEGHDGKPGWLSSDLGKTLLYNAEADACRNGEVTIHNFTTMQQLQSIEGSTLRAPEGENDDRADAHALAVVARKKAADPWIGVGSRDRDVASQSGRVENRMPGGVPRDRVTGGDLPSFVSEIESLKV